MRKPGCIEPVVYFRFPNGHITLAPYSDMPTPNGAIREGADTLAQVDRLQERLLSQEKQQWEREAQRDAATFGKLEEAVRDRLYARMTSAATDDYEKEFIRLYLQLRDEKKRKRYRDLYLQRTAYLWARENDSPGRRVDQERFDVERHEVKS
jgi:hypothetical protein